MTREGLLELAAMLASELEWQIEYGHQQHKCDRSRGLGEHQHVLSCRRMRKALRRYYAATESETA